MYVRIYFRLCVYVCMHVYDEYTGPGSGNHLGPEMLISKEGTDKSRVSWKREIKETVEKWYKIIHTTSSQSGRSGTRATMMDYTTDLKFMLCMYVCMYVYTSHTIYVRMHAPIYK